MSTTDLEPLTCTTCRAPVPLGDGDDVRCPSCESQQPLPIAYREFRDARKLSDEDARTLDGLCEAIAAPAPAWKEVAIFIGYGVGALTLVVLAIGALVGAVAGFAAAAKLEAEGTIGVIIIALCAAVCGLVSVPLVGELLVFMLVHKDFSLAADVALGEAPQLHVDLWVGAALYFFSILHIAIAYRTQVDVKALDELRAQLAAQPALKGGVLGCRACGAPLTVKENAVAARCLYCQAESLVRISGVEAAKQKATSFSVRRGVREALASHHATLAADRKQMWLMLLAGPLIAPVVALGGATLHYLAN